MNFKKFLFSIIASIIFMQNLTAMYRMTPRIGQAFSTPFLNQKNKELKNLTPKTIANPELMEQAAADFQTTSQEKQRLGMTTPVPQIQLHPKLKKAYEISQQKLKAKETESQKLNPQNEEPKKSQEQDQKTNFWDSAYKNMKTGAQIAGVTGTTGSVGYGYLKNKETEQAEKQAKQNYNELQKNFANLETMIKAFNPDQSKWTDFDYNVFNQYLTLYNYLIESLSSEELVAEYAHLQNQLIAIEDINFSNFWTDKISSEKKWSESQDAYKERKKSETEEYQKNFIPHEENKQKHIQEIENAANDSDHQLIRKIKGIKPTVTLENYKIKSIPNFQPKIKRIKNRSFTFTLPDLPEAIHANLNEGNF